MKKFLITLLFLVPFMAHAYNVKIDGIYYNLDKAAMTAEVTNETGNWDAQSYSGDVVIPSAIISDGVNYSVTSIGNQAFLSCSGLASVSIPNSIMSIGNQSFQFCSGLTSVAIPSSVTSIEGYAFYGCSGLTSVVIPSSVTSIGNMAFAVCRSLTSINVEGDNPSFSSIDGVLFNKAQTLLVQHPCGKEGSYAIPASVTSIGSGAFGECSGLTSVTFPASVTSIGSNAFYSCSGLTSVTFPNSVKNIEYSAFYGCSGLTSVTIPASVRSIGLDAFLECSSLTSINVESSNFSYSSVDGVLFNKTRKTLIQCPGGKKGSYAIPASVTSIEDDAFVECRGLTSVTIPASVTSIGAYTFYGCSGLSSVCIPNSVTSIGYAAFADCSSLETLCIGSGVREIGFEAFAGAENITAVYSFSAIPPVCESEDVFDGNVYKAAVLYVPAETGAVALYQAEDIWKNFHEIVAADLSGIDSPSIDSENTGNTLFNLQGQRIAAPRHGVNISNGKKILVR